jgi:hypothetical protein
MRLKFGIHWIGYKIIASRRGRRKAYWTVRIALGVMILGIVFLTGCGVFRRALRTETRTAPPIVTQVAPTIAQETTNIAPPALTPMDTPVTGGITVAPNPTPTHGAPPARATEIPTASGAQVVPSTGIALGIYLPQKDTSGANIDVYIRETGKKPAFAWLPMTWQHPDGSYWQFDSRMLDEFRTRGIMPGLTWEPSKGAVESYTVRQVGINQAVFSWKSIASGRHDEYITQFAKDAAAYHYPFILRILHEMDGTWYPWGYSVNGNTNPADYVAAWKHIVDIFRKENATNVQFVWCPSVLSPDLIQKYGAILKQLYPGDDYVDWLGLDGYSNAQNGYRSLQEEFKPTYDFITGFSTFPVIIYEIGAAVNPSNPMAQADWIMQGLLKTIPNQLPKVKVVTWFNSRDGSGRDYRLQTSPHTIAAWKQVVASPLYQGSLIK